MSLEEVLASVTPGSAEEALARQVNFDRLPAHVAVIMDGNGRWAAQRHLPRVEGHRAGIDSVRDVVEGSARLGIEVLTLYAFSVENWKRPAAEVSTLMMLLKRYLRSSSTRCSATTSGSRSSAGWKISRPTCSGSCATPRSGPRPTPACSSTSR